MAEQADFPIVRVSGLVGKWSGKGQVPGVGSRVRVAMNDLGPAEVLEYVLRHGLLSDWIGLRVKFLDPPAWYVKQNDGNIPGVVYGIDLEE